MKSVKIRILSLVLLLIMILNVLFVACGEKAPNESGGDPNNDRTPGGDYQMPEDEYKLPLEDGYNQLTIYWRHSGS